MRRVPEQESIGLKKGIGAEAECFVAARGDRRLDNDVVPALPIQQRFERELVLSIDKHRRHDGQSRRFELGQVAFVNVPSHDLWMVLEMCPALGEFDPLQELVRVQVVIPGRADHTKVERRPILGGVVPSGVLSIHACTVQQFKHQIRIWIRFGHDQTGDESDASTHAGPMPR